MKILFFCFLLFPNLVRAETRMHFESNFTTDNSNLKTSGAGSRSYIEGMMSFDMYKDGAIYFSAGIANYQAIEPASATTTSTFTAMVPFAGLTYFFGRPIDRKMSIGVYYAPVVNASYQETDTGTEIWSGSGYLTKISLHPQLTRYLSVVISLNYLSTSFSNKSGTAVSTATSFSRTSIIPTFGLELYW